MNTVGKEKVSRFHSCRKSFDGNVSRGGLGQLSPLLPKVDDQRMKVQFKKLNVQWKLASEIRKVKC